MSALFLGSRDLNKQSKSLFRIHYFFEATLAVTVKTYIQTTTEAVSSFEMLI